ncbi:MAG: hypothetical protein IJB96_08020 [Lachnospira sp.]|nr:hypothetical protein [Lachnospira sp.]
MAKITHDVLKDMVAAKRIPILTLDPRWYQLIPEASKTDEIKYWESKVNELLKRQGQITNDLKDVKKIKNQLIQTVVSNMEDDGSNSRKRKKLMDQNQKLIYEAKDKIEQLEDEERELPRELNMANQRLMIETAKFCYSKMNDNKEDLEVLNKWIDATRVKLKKNLLIKQDKETQNEQLYSGLHDLLGPEVMGQLDKINEE